MCYRVCRCTCAQDMIENVRQLLCECHVCLPVWFCELHWHTDIEYDVMVPKISGSISAEFLCSLQTASSPYPASTFPSVDLYSLNCLQTAVSALLAHPALLLGQLGAISHCRSYLPRVSHTSILWCYLRSLYGSFESTHTSRYASSIDEVSSNSDDAIDACFGSIILIRG